MENEKKMILVFNTSSAYLNATYVAIHSVIKKSKRNFKVYIFVSSDVTELQKARLQEIENLFANAEICLITIKSGVISDNRLVSNRIPNIAYSRLFSCDFIMEDKCLYLDQDIFVNGDIAELFDIELGDSFIAAGIEDSASKEYKSALKKDFSISIEKYINAGVILMNLKLMRIKKWTDKIRILISKEFPLGDQDVLNVAADNKVLYLKTSYNMQRLVTERVSQSDFFIVHYAGPRKPWNYIEADYAKEWWFDCQQTNVFSDFLEKTSVAFYNCYLTSANFSHEDIFTLCRKSCVYIFGAGIIGRRACKILHDRNIEIASFLVSDVSIQEKSFDNEEKIYSFTDVKDKENCVVLVAVNRDSLKIKYQLLNAGYKNVYNVAHLFDCYVWR